jgi:hypothetical protein
MESTLVIYIYIYAALQRTSHARIARWMRILYRPILGHLLIIPRKRRPAVFPALRPCFISARQTRWIWNFGDLLSYHISYTNTTTGSVGSFEAVRLEVVRLAPPLPLALGVAGALPPPFVIAVAPCFWRAPCFVLAVAWRWRALAAAHCEPREFWIFQHNELSSRGYRCSTARPRPWVASLGTLLTSACSLQPNLLCGTYLTQSYSVFHPPAQITPVAVTEAQLCAC